MKRTTLLTLITLFVFSGVAFAAQPYTTKKAAKLLKAQSPTVVVKDLPKADIVIKAKKINTQLNEFSKDIVEVKPVVPVVEKKERTQSTSIAASTYMPTAKQLRKAKRAEKKLQKLDKNKESANGSKSLVAALLLCFFVGIFGIHRFYMGYYAIGILQLLTLGFFGIWTLIDFILLLVGELQPKNGQFEQSLDDEIDGLF